MMNTNGLSDTDTWFEIPNSDVTNQAWLLFDPTLTNVFFRLIYP